MAEVDQDTQWCSNCKRDIAISNFVMHEVHCRRNIILCEECKEPISRSQRDEHYEQYHAPVTCELCNKQLQREILEEHKENECPKRSVRCLFCELEMPAADLNEHEDFCGSRTELCTRCQHYIMYKDLDQHEKSNCSFPTTKSRRNDDGFDLTAAADLQNGSSQRFGVNDFAVEEISRMLSGTSASINHGAFQQNNLRTMTSMAESVPVAPVRTINDIHPLDHKPGLGAVRKTTKKLKENSDRERENRSQRESNYYANHNNQESDELLAFQLENEDVVMLPCEFCGHQVSIDDLIVHQSACQMTDIANLSMNDEELLDTIPNNKTEQLLPPISNRSKPNIIDNAAYTAAVNELSNPDLNAVQADSYSQDDTLLPCEFCDKLFPNEILIQHQAVCDVNKWYDRGRHASSNRTRANSLKNRHYNSSSSIATQSLKNSLPNEDRGLSSIKGSTRNVSNTRTRNIHSNPAMASQNQNRKAINESPNEYQQTGETDQNGSYVGNNHQMRGSWDRSVRGTSRGKRGGHLQSLTSRPPQRGQGSRGASSNRPHSQRGSRSGQQQYRYRDRLPSGSQQVSARFNGNHQNKSSSHDTHQLTAAGREAANWSESHRLSIESQAAGGSTVGSNFNSNSSDMGVTGSKARRSNKQRYNTEGNGAERRPAIRGQQRGRLRGQQREHYNTDNF